MDENYTKNLPTRIRIKINDSSVKNTAQSECVRFFSRTLALMLVPLSLFGWIGRRTIKEIILYKKVRFCIIVPIGMITWKMLEQTSAPVQCWCQSSIGTIGRTMDNQVLRPLFPGTKRKLFPKKHSVRLSIDKYAGNNSRFVCRRPMQFLFRWNNSSGPGRNQCNSWEIRRHRME